MFLVCIREFCAMVIKIYIYTKEEVQRMNIGSLNSRGEETSSVAEGVDCVDTRTLPSPSSPDHA